MRNSYRAVRPVRLRRFHHARGITKRRKIKLPRTFFCLAVVMLAGLALVDMNSLLPKDSANNAVSNTSTNAEISALQESIRKANSASSQDEDLAELIKHELSYFPTSQKWSVYVNDLNSGRSASVNAEQTYAAGNLSKLFLLAPLEMKIPQEKWNYYWYGGLSLTNCVMQALGEADNDCLKEAAEYVGLDEADRYNKSLGFVSTKLDTKNGRAETNAKEVGSLLTQLKRSAILSDLGRRLAFDSLYHQDYMTGIASACSKCVVAHKKVDSDGLAHDAGIVTRAKKDYVVVIMSEGGTSKQIARLSRVIDEKLNP